MSNYSEEQLITKLFEGKCSREELSQLLDVVASHPDRDYTAVMEKLWDELGEYPYQKTKVSERMFNATLVKMKEREKPKINSFFRTVSLKRREMMIGIGAIAAAVVLALGIGLWLFPIPTDSQLTVITTTFAEQRTLSLPDGSTVELNANSSISFQDTWDDAEKRKVWLKGEAFFHVTKKQETGQKFCVFTDDLMVEVLGTSFNVNTHHQETKVFLEEGKVKLNLEEAPEPILMEPGELVSYSQKTKKTVKHNTLQQEPSSWRDGFVVLEDSPLKEILQKINEIYGLDYRVVNESSIKRKSFRIAIPINNYTMMVSVFEEVTGLKVQKIENQLVIE